MADELDEVVGAEDTVEGDEEDTNEEAAGVDSPVMPDGTDDNVNPTASPEGEDPDGMK